MRKSSLKEKLLLIIFGLFLTFFLLEIGLRLAGAIVLYLQERHNHVSFSQNEYRILCLGESTTALGGEDSYPSQLEEMLNRQSHTKKFTVINKGIISTTTNTILAHLDQNLDKYRPRLVIIMMGINDKSYMQDPYKVLWWENVKWFFKDFRVYKLGHLLYEHITHRIKEINAPAEEPVDLPQARGGNYQQVENVLKALIAESIVARKSVEASLFCLELAQRYRLQGRFQEAQDILERATVFNPKNAGIYQEWGELYLAQEKNDDAIKAFQAALTLEPQNIDSILGLAHAYHKNKSDNAFLFYAEYLQINPQDYWGYIELARWLRENKHLTQAEEYLNHAIEVGPYYDQAYVDLGQVLDEMREYRQEEAFYLKEISLHPKASRLYQALGQFYRAQDKEDLAKRYFEQAAQHEMTEYYPATLVNFSLVLNKILARHIKVIVMQYPLRNISSLKDYLGQRKGVTFVENKVNFKQALSRGGYGQYFKDNFAMDFGHCTREGNRLIAGHLTEVILKNE